MKKYLQYRRGYICIWLLLCLVPILIQMLYGQSTGERFVWHWSGKEAAIYIYIHGDIVNIFSYDPLFQWQKIAGANLCHNIVMKANAV